MKTMKLIFGILLAVILTSGFVPVKVISAVPAHAQGMGCGGYYGEGCGSGYYQEQIARHHHLPCWGGCGGTIAPRHIRAHPVVIGVPTGYGCAGCYNGGAASGGSSRYWYYHRRVEHRYVRHYQGGYRAAAVRPGVGSNCTMVKPYWGEPGYVWSDGRCHHLPPSYDP